MPKPNNPYAHTIDATKPTAVRVGDYYGTRATDKAINHAAGGRNIAPASRYQAAGTATYDPPTPQPLATSPSPEATSPKPKRGKGKKAESAPEPESLTEAVSEPTVTAEDLFQW